MKDIFNDPEFEKTLYGGVHDLDEDIGLLVWTLYKSALVHTSWSCSGHIAEYHIDAGRSSRPTTHLVYLPGRLHFKENREKSRSSDFVDYLRMKVAKTPYAILKEEDEIRLTLEMEDISEPGNSARYGEVQIDKARKRYSEFVDFWKDLQKIAETLK